MRSHPIRVNPICPKQSAPYNSVKPFPWSNLPIVNCLFLPRDIWMDSTMKNKKNWRQNIFSILFVENVVSMTLVGTLKRLYASWDAL